MADERPAKAASSDSRSNAIYDRHNQSASGETRIGNPAAMQILDYIKHQWIVLRRSHKDLAAAAPDPKFRPSTEGRYPVYVAATEDLDRIEQQLRRAMTPPDFQKIELRRLPSTDAPAPEPGLLYLPKPYVVPEGVLTRCMAGIATSFRWACFMMATSSWPGTW